jgi:putative ABC transport system permease protein
MREILGDIRFGLRLLLKSPGFTVVSLLALALGIGATTAIFSLLYSVLLAPLGYPNPDQLVMVWSHRNGARMSVSSEDYLDWQRQNTVFQSLDAWTGTGFTISTQDWTDQIQATRCSSGFFDNLMGQRTALGRHFLPEESQVGNDHVVILNHSCWKQRFGSDPDIVGKTLRMSGESYTVVGVAAPSPSDRGAGEIRWSV